MPRPLFFHQTQKWRRTMTFRSYDDAVAYGKTYGKEYCRPCDKWVVVRADKDLWQIAIKFKLSGDHVGFVQ